MKFLRKFFRMLDRLLTTEKKCCLDTICPEAKKHSRDCK